MNESDYVEGEDKRREKRNYYIEPDMLVNPELFTENIRCPICHNLFNDPMVCASCLNHFCSLCIQQAMKYQKRCPLCQQTKEIRRAVPLLRNMLAPITIYCAYRQNGCQEQIGYDLFQKHIDECGFQIDFCEQSFKGQQCKYKCLRNEMQDHKTTKCQFRQVQCDHCANPFIFKDLEAHKDICEEATLECPHCHDLYKRKDREQHPTNCDQNFQKCVHCLAIMLYRDVLLHEPDCEYRKVPCSGCQQNMELRQYYTHQGDCLEFPQICPNCQVKMPRHQLLSHSVQQCISNVRQYFLEQISVLKDELTVAQVQAENQKRKAEFRFSPSCKDADVFISPCRMIATVREQKKKRKDRFSLFKQPLQLQCSSSWTIKVITLKSEWFAVGITDGSSIYLAKRYQDLGHGSYLVSANGVIYNSHKAVENWQVQTQFRIDQGDILKISYDHQFRILNFNNLSKDLTAQITLDTDFLSPVYPCVCLRTATDSVQILTQ